MRTSTLTLAALAMAVAGCSGRVPIAYDPPGPRPNAGGPIVACRALEDARTDRSIDEAIEGGAVPAVDRVIREEIASAAVARAIVPAGPGGDEGATIVVEPVLEELVWEVPGYRRIWMTTFLLSVATGGVGGLIYASTPTDVIGRTRLRIRMVDTRSTREVTKTYAASSQERMAKLSSDSPGTQSRVVGRALGAAMQEFRGDVAAFAAPAAPDAP